MEKERRGGSWYNERNAKGKSYKEIASSLFISEKTVKTHVSHVLSKLELADRTQAALYAVDYQKNQPKELL
ncbi:hypothetical protein BSAF29S_07127 [Bacillus safensis subsp. safensis]